ncbi:hypothetical protein DW094_09190 [Ruminococcaceae bacterium AM07-15]|nr:hypothetical protein DW094_09190 [Ruminococcaceae bacterium AM07-15]
MEDGEVCTCQQAQQNQAQAQQQAAPQQNVQYQAPQQAAPQPGAAPAVSAQGKQVMDALLKDLVGLVKAPATTAPGYVRRGDVTVSVIFLLLQGICSAIFALFCIGKINSLIALGGSMTQNIKFSGVGAFFLTLLYTVIFEAVLAGLYFGVGKLLGGQLRFQEALSIVSMRSVILVPVILVSCLVFLLNISAGIVFYYFAGALAGVIFLVAGSNGIANLTPDRKVYLNLIVTVVFTLIFLFLGTKLLPSYVPSSLREFFSTDNLMNMLSNM